MSREKRAKRGKSEKRATAAAQVSELISSLPFIAAAAASLIYDLFIAAHT
jgi:hypothetical protein